MYSLVCDHVTDLHTIRPTKVTSLPSLRPAGPCVVGLTSSTPHNFRNQCYWLTWLLLPFNCCWLPASVCLFSYALPTSFFTSYSFPHCVCLLNIESSFGSYKARKNHSLKWMDVKRRSHKRSRTWFWMFVTRCHLLSLPPPHQTHVAITAPRRGVRWNVCMPFVTVNALCKSCGGHEAQLKLSSRFILSAHGRSVW